jgi:hypothetical protein
MANVRAPNIDFSGSNQPLSQGKEAPYPAGVILPPRITTVVVAPLLQGTDGWGGGGQNQTASHPICG